MNRRHTVLISLGTIAAVIGVACSGDDDSSSNVGTDGRSTAGDATTPVDDRAFTPVGEIDVWVHESPTANQVLSELFDEYEEEHPDVTVNLLEIPFADFETNSLRSTSAGDGPDLVKLSGWVLPDWADKGLLVPMEPELVGFENRDEMIAAFEDGVLEGVSFDDEIYALPVDYQNLMLFYNRAHFEEAGLDPDDPPETWEEVVEIGEQLTQRSGDQVDRAGFMWWYNVPIWVYLEIESLAVQLGGSVLDSDGTEGALGTDAGRGAVDYYLGLSNEEGIASFDLLAPSMLDAFADGNVSMMVSGAFSFATDGAAETVFEEEGNLGVAPMPVFEDADVDATAAYSWGWGVTNNADDPQVAGHLAKWLTEPERADRLFAEAGIATPYAGFADSETATLTPANEILVEQIDRSIYGPRIPRFTEMMTELSQQVEAGATGQMPAEQIVDDFDTAMQRVLR